ncbi:hypothetical protein [Aquimarina sp. 2201CG5-10]|uniref:hypothetical protein n=1 Tax=Aquimarina callyspongiae TaxID=3098150 RepID=UPI002AB542B6|nr:hypothetical protein [Aquimarina sp. 2201CG5-10]MDY8138745.1 hypothetical protein [Aquimarina sp. 2201CG5-10]
MNRIIYLCLLVVFFSCKSNMSIAQEKESDKSETPKVEKPKFTDIGNTVNPNTIALIGTIRDISKDSNICNQQFRFSANIIVKRTINSGSSIINMIYPEQEIKIAFTDAIIKDFDLLNRKSDAQRDFTFTLEERLCSDLSQTVYVTLKIEN